MWPNQSAAANRRPAGQLDGSGNLAAIVAADRAFPAAVAELGRSVKMKFQTLPLLALIGCISSGCFYPHKQWDSAAISGRAVDSISQTPIRGVSVTSSPWGGKMVTTITDEQGVFKFDAQRNLHWIIFDRGVFSYLEFSHSTYDSKRDTAVMGSIGDRYDSEIPSPHVMGDIQLLRTSNTEPDGAANGSQPFRSETNTTSSTAGSRR